MFSRAPFSAAAFASEGALGPIVVSSLLITSSVGTVTVSAEGTTQTTGVASSFSIGSVSIVGEASVAPTGVATSGQTGTTGVVGDASVSVSIQAPLEYGFSGSPFAASPFSGGDTIDVEISSQLGQVTALAAADVDAIGQEITSDYGDLSIVAEANVLPTGQEFSANLGTISVRTQQIITPTGLEFFGLYTEPSVLADANLTLDSLLITTSIGDTNIWDDVVPSLPETIWTRIAA